MKYITKYNHIELLSCMIELIVSEWFHMVTWNLVNIGLDTGLLPGSIKPLSELI